MKNIRTYKPEKYTGPDYEEVEPNIYKTHYTMSESENSLSLKGISDEDKAEMLRNMNGWKQGEGNCEEDLYVLIYEGKKYYREMDENESDANNSYVEFASDDIEYIRKLLSIIGKHVYNKKDGEYIKLVIE